MSSRKPRKKKVTASIDWKNYGRDECVVPICIRSPAINGRNLEVTLDAIRENVPNVTLMMCDTLDRYNLGGDIDAARKNADKWLMENLVRFHERFNKVDLIRWDDVRADEDCQKRLAILTEQYRSNKAMKAIMDANVWCYVGPKLERDGYGGYDFEEDWANSTAYLLEEYAGTMTYRTWFAGQSEIYWGVYISDVDIFNKAIPHAGIDLTMPETLPVTINRLGCSRAGETTALQQRDIRMLLNLGVEAIAARA